MIVIAIAVLFTACTVAGGFIGARTRHATDGALIGLIGGPVGVIALWCLRTDNWS